MSYRSLWTTSLSASVLVILAGCHHCGEQRAAAPPPMYEPCPPPVNVAPSPLTPTQVAPINTAPPAGLVPQSSIPPAPVPSGPGSDTVPPVGPEIRGYVPNGAVPPNPEILKPADTPQTPRLSPPVITEEPPPAPGATKPPKTDTPARPKKSAADDQFAGFPVGIPQFSVAMDGVTAGLKPSVYGGLDWLQANGYKTVLHVQLPATDDAADRSVIAKYGLKYVSLNVSPKTLCRATLAEFDRVVNDRANRPLFVYDQNGILAGGLWYLHFRLTEHDSDETARLRAARLGLKADNNPENREMWLAVQQLVKDGIP